MSLKGKPKLITAVHGATPTTLYTCPASTESAIHTLFVSNISGGAITLTLQVFNSADNTTVTIKDTYTIDADSEYTFPKVLTLGAGDIIKATASANTGLVAYVSQNEDSSSISQGFTARGEWGSGANYVKNDVVSLSGTSYVASQSSSNQNPSSATAYWTVLASKGNAGSGFDGSGNASASGQLNIGTVNSTNLKNPSGNLLIDSASQIVEIKGDGSSIEGQIQLNCHDNSHGQRLKAQPHSEGVSNTMFLPKGASSTLVSQIGTATITNKTYFDLDGNLRDIPNSRTFADTTVSASQTDTGNFIFLTSSDQTVVIPNASGTFDTGDIFSIVCAGASATISSNITSMFKVGEASATATITLGTNKIASVLFVSAQHAYVTGT